MSDLVERVARAICAQHAMYPADMQVIGRNNETRAYWTEFSDDARAAIAEVFDALEHPSEAMIADAWVKRSEMDEAPTFGITARILFQAMLTQARTEAGV